MHKAIVSISLLWAGALSGAGFAFLTHVILARVLGPEGFGLFAAAYSMSMLLVPLAGFGISQFWLKEFGRQGWETVSVVPQSLFCVAISTSCALAIMILWALGGPHGASFRWVLIIMGAYVAGQVSVELVAGKLQLEEKYRLLALWQISPHVIRLVLIVALGLFGHSALGVLSAASVYAVVAVVFMVFGSVALCSMASGDFELKGHGAKSPVDGARQPALLSILSGAWPFALAGVFHLIYFQSDVILVKYITGDEAAGFYNVAFTVMVAIMLFPGIVYQKYLLPKLHRWAYQDRALFYRVYRQGNLVMLGIGLAAMLVLWILAPPVLPLLFGTGYAESVELLRILALSIPVLFMASSVGATLVTQEHMRTKVLLMGVVAVINIILNLWLIPLYGATGAAAATVASNVVLLGLYYLAAERVVFGKEREAWK